MIKLRLTSLPRPSLAAAALSLALAGCASLDGADTAQAPRRAAPNTAAAQPVVPPPPPRPVAKAAELKTLRPAPRPTPEHEAAGAAPLAPKLVGLSEDETIDLLGHPAEESTQPPGKIWIYKAGGCQLSVHLFPDMDRGGYYALDYSADGSRDTCLGKVAGEARKRGGALSQAGAQPS